MKNENLLLKFYSITITGILTFFLILSFKPIPEQQRFEEISVERINIVEPDGSLKMVISNQHRQHPGIANGKIIERETPRPPGMLFFNQIGDEMGGLVFGEKGENSHWG